MALNMHQRPGARVQRVAIGRSHGSTQNVSVGALAIPLDTQHRPAKRPVSGNAKEMSITRNPTLDACSDSLQFAMTEALPEGGSSANVIAVVELLARVEELLRPSNESRETVLTVGPLQLDLLTRRVQREDRRIDLRPREFCLLEYMMRRKGQVLTRAMLFMDVWNYKFTPQSNLVDVHIGRLRHKVDAPCEPPMIYNIRGQGFVLRAPD